MEDYVDVNDPISIKFQGIEMRGINDSQSFLRYHPNMEEEEIDSKIGVPVKVYIQRGTKTNALVTFHDIGTNHISFLSFFNYPEMRVILENFTVYHICAPGHQNSPRSINNEPPHAENFQLLSGRTSSSESASDPFTSSRESLKQRTFLNYPTMAELADIVADVVDHFQLKFFIGFGMGAGSNVLTRYGLLYPNKLLGLFLINPNDTTTGYYPWTRAIWSDIPYLKSGVATDWLQNWLLDHWFGACTERNMDLEQSYLQLVDELNPVAVAGYIESYMNRTALGLIRPINSLETNATTLKVDSFLVAGEMSTDLARAMVEMNGNLDPSKTQFISIPDATGAVIDELPSKVATLFLSYLRNIGILVTLTPEKLHKAAIERQIEQAKLMSVNETFQMNYESVDKC